MDSTKKANQNLFHFLHNHITALSTSKLFAGLMIILLNISSKFVTIKLSKTMESYLKYTFSRNVLIFAIAYVGSRDIYVAVFITLLFILCMDYLFNEESSLCILPESFKEYHINMIENMDNNTNDKTTPPTIDQINQAIKVLSQVRLQS